MIFIVVKIGAMISCLRSALVSKFIKGIISDDIPITRLLGETKLSQNLPENILSPNLYGKLLISLKTRSVLREIKFSVKIGGENV